MCPPPKSGNSLRKPPARRWWSGCENAWTIAGWTAFCKRWKTPKKSWAWIDPGAQPVAAWSRSLPAPGLAGTKQAPTRGAGGGFSTLMNGLYRWAQRISDAVDAVALHLANL